MFPHRTGRGGGQPVPARQNRAGFAAVSPHGDRKIGRVTSAVRSPKLDRGIALGYLRREFTCPGTAVTLRGGGGEQPAVVTELPFVPNDY